MNDQWITATDETDRIMESLFFIIFLLEQDKVTKLIECPVQWKVPIFVILDYRHPYVQKFFTVPVLYIFWIFKDKFVTATVIFFFAVRCLTRVILVEITTRHCS